MRRRLQREDCRDESPDPDGDPRRQPGEAERRFMVLRRRWDVPARCRFSHAAQGLVACQEDFPELKVVMRSKLCFQPFVTNTRSVHFGSMLDKCRGDGAVAVSTACAEYLGYALPDLRRCEV
jgi:hypothetical protein